MTRRAKEIMINRRKIISDILIITIILSTMFLSGCGKNTIDKVDNSEKQQIESESNNADDENIKRGTAKDENDLTGTYVDEESGEKLVVIQEGNVASYCLYDSEGVENENYKAKDKEIVGNYIDGEMSFITKNMDNSLSITSGVGEPWGNFKRVSKDAEIDFTGFDERMSYVGDDDVEEDDDNELEIIEENVERETVTVNSEVLGYPLYYVGDDGDFLDELLANAWFDENGAPIAKYLPDRVLNPIRGGNDRLEYTENFRFIDGINWSIDKLKRTGESENLYALLLQDISKKQGSDGTMWNYATEYYSQETIVFKGNFRTMLNGDNIILFAEYTGLADDDTANFKGYYAEIHNEGRF